MRPRAPGVLAMLAMAVAMGGVDGPRGDTTLPTSNPQPREVDVFEREAKRSKRAERGAQRYAKSNRKADA